MGYFNKRSYIDKIVLKVKIGNKQEFARLREMYAFLLDQIYDGLAETYPFLKTRKVDIFHDFYFFFWEAIKEYDFNSDFSFSHHLKESLLDNSRKAISSQYGYEEGDVVSKHIIKKSIRKNKPKKHRKIIIRALKSLTVRRKQAVYLHCYRGYTYEECRNIMGISGINVYWKMRNGYGHINNNLVKVKKGEKRIKYKEKVHKIYQQKMESIK